MLRQHLVSRMLAGLRSWCTMGGAQLCRYASPAAASWGENTAVIALVSPTALTALTALNATGQLCCLWHSDRSDRSSMLQRTQSPALLSL